MATEETVCAPRQAHRLLLEFQRVPRPNHSRRLNPSKAVTMLGAIGTARPLRVAETEIGGSRFSDRKAITLRNTTAPASVSGTPVGWSLPERADKADDQQQNHENAKPSHGPEDGAQGPPYAAGSTRRQLARRFRAFADLETPSLRNLGQGLIPGTERLAHRAAHGCWPALFRHGNSSCQWPPC